VASRLEGHLTADEAHVQLELNHGGPLAMKGVINAKELRASLPSVVKRVRGGERITVIYRSRPAFQIVPLDTLRVADSPLDADPLFRAEAVGRSQDGGSAAEHDAVLYRS
jgi:prevent-host-death family protein